MRLLNPFIFAAPSAYPKLTDWTGFTGGMNVDVPGGLEAPNGGWGDTAYSVDQAGVGQKIEAFASEALGSNGNRIIGLQQAGLVGSTVFNTVPYSFFRFLNTIYAYASGTLTNLGTVPGFYTDVFSIRDDGTDITVRVNGTVIHTWAAASLARPVRIMAFGEAGAHFRDLMVNIF